MTTSTGAQPQDCRSPRAQSARKALLATCVLHDIDLVPAESGALLGPAGVLAPWSMVEELAHGSPDGSPRGFDDQILRLRVTLPLVQVLGEEGASGAARLFATARPLALSRDHVMHPDNSWARERVPGGALDLGIGLLSPPGSPGRVAPLPSVLCEYFGLDVDSWWPGLHKHLHSMGAAAAERLRDTREGTLHPMGGCDVPTLLASPALRAALCSAPGMMRSVAVPTRGRGWFDLRSGDPAFIGAAWSLTEPLDRGMSHALLVGRHEVSRAPRRAAPPGHPGRGNESSALDAEPLD